MSRKRGRWTDIARRWAPLLLIALVSASAGAWAMVKWYRAGANDRMVNVAVSTEVLPYGEDTRLLVVHVHTKNPSDVSLELRKPEDMFQVTVAVVPDDLEAGELANVGDDDTLATDDLLPDDGYVFIPRAEFDDLSSVVVPAGAHYSVKAEIQRDRDYVSAETLVFVPAVPGSEPSSVRRGRDELQRERPVPRHTAFARQMNTRTR